MIHFTCDVCGKDMPAHDHDRFVVHVEIRAADDNGMLSEEDLEEDNLEKVSELLKQAEKTGQDLFEDNVPVRNRYDLCAKCRDRFLKMPFNCQAQPNFNFSEN